ncbi:hypothetical protein SR1949_00600 [Sphaerospermopsis reniformis]|uniref:Uncharacterized protein n=1 Tax=Sphaerospermopsis reniformis TaxID=531300 RepID=A0A479ZUS3_9CYAN|nr:hypothetical protein SR1949_00600 [Sphaerospermopsis reniformis]
MASPRFAIRSQEKELIFCQHLAVGFRRFPSVPEIFKYKE